MSHNRQLKVLKKIISWGHIEPDFYCHGSSLIWIALNWDLDFFIWLIGNSNIKWEPKQWNLLLEILVRREVEKNIYNAAEAIAKNRGWSRLQFPRVTIPTSGSIYKITRN